MCLCFCVSPHSHPRSDVVKIQNLRFRARRLAAAMRALAQYGPLRPVHLRGLDNEDLKKESKSDDVEIDGDADPTGQRVGVAPEDNAAAALVYGAAELEAATTSHTPTTRNAVVNIDTIFDAVQAARSAIQTAYPSALPEDEPVQLIVADREELKGTEAGKQVLSESSAIMWFAGRQLQREHTMAEALKSRNEKMTIVAKMTGPTMQAPQKEPSIDEETRKKMMALYFKKQKQAQETAEDDDQSYLNSAWADPHAYKKSVHGLGSISAFR
jgi:cilia- and flagella-associated protein 298